MTDKLLKYEGLWKKNWSNKWVYYWKTIYLQMCSMWLWHLWLRVQALWGQKSKNERGRSGKSQLNIVNLTVYFLEEQTHKNEKKNNNTPKSTRNLSYLSACLHWICWHWRSGWVLLTHSWWSVGSSYWAQGCEGEAAQTFPLLCPQQDSPCSHFFALDLFAAASPSPPSGCEHIFFPLLVTLISIETKKKRLIWERWSNICNLLTYLIFPKWS